MAAGLFIYFPMDPGQNIYFQVFDGQDIYFKKQNFTIKLRGRPFDSEEGGGLTAF